MSNSELLSKERKNLFWELIDLWIEPNKASDCTTAKCCVERIVSDSKSLLSASLGSIFELSLTLRSASPRLVLYRQLAEDSLASLTSEGVSLEQSSEEPTGQGEFFHKPASIPRGTCCWVDTGSKLLFNTADLLLWLEKKSNRSFVLSLLTLALFHFRANSFNNMGAYNFQVPRKPPLWGIVKELSRSLSNQPTGPQIAERGKNMENLIDFAALNLFFFSLLLKQGRELFGPA